jgi:glycerol-3-phosphate acyltransferase PlsY
MFLKIVLIVLIAYFIGNFSPSFILGKMLEKKDIRKFGSGNAGSTNAIRVFGLKIGIITFLCDILKGILAVIIGGIIGKSIGLFFIGQYIAAFFVIIGHNWPILLKFKGGKGIASTLGVYLFLDPMVAGIAFLISIGIIIKTRYVSLASLVGSFLIFIMTLILRWENKPFVLLTFLLALLAFYRHRANIKRLLNGTESKFGEKAK